MMNNRREGWSDCSSGNKGEIVCFECIQFIPYYTSALPPNPVNAIHILRFGRVAIYVSE